MLESRREGPNVAALAMLCVICSWISVADAAEEPRFGDTTWVAPAGDVASDPTRDGPRVAPPDHEPTHEKVLRAPFRLVFLPLRLVAMGIEAAAGRVGDRVAAPPGAREEAKFSITPQIDIGRLNDNGLRGVGYGPSLTLKGFPTEASRMNLRGSWSGLDRRRIDFNGVVGDRRPIGARLDAHYNYEPSRRYYGIGNDSREADKSIYLLEDIAVETALVLGSSWARQVELMGGFSSMSPSRGYLDSPLLENVFTPEEAPFFGENTRVLFYGVRAHGARLDDRKHPSRGIDGVGVFRHGVGVDDGDPDFHQWSVEGRGFVPVFANRRVLAVRVVYSGVDPTGDIPVQPFYRLATTEHEYRFAGYNSQRFRDRRLALGRLEYRWLVHRHVSALGFYELGEVAPHTRSLKGSDAHVSWGGGFRFSSSRISSIRIEIGQSVEGTHLALYAGRGNF